MSDLDGKLQELVNKRDSLAEHLRRLEGRRESAEKALEAVRKECRDLKVDPDQLDSLISTLESKYSSMVAELEEKITQSETALSPYLE